MAPRSAPPVTSAGSTWRTTGRPFPEGAGLPPGLPLWSAVIKSLARFMESFDMVNQNAPADRPAPPENTLAREGATIAYRRTEGSTPGVIFMGGFKSDMTRTKAVALEAFCRSRGTAFVRFDYQGHGASSGRFEDGS